MSLSSFKLGYQVVSPSDGKVTNTGRLLFVFYLGTVPNIMLHRIKQGTKADLAVPHLNRASCWQLAL